MPPLAAGRDRAHAWQEPTPGGRTEVAPIIGRDFPPPEDALPPGWKSGVDNSGNQYFYNKELNVSQWTRPESHIPGFQSNVHQRVDALLSVQDAVQGTNDPVHDGSEHVVCDKVTDEGAATLSELFRYATAFDVLCMLVGFLGSGAVGVAQPGLMVLFGNLVDVLGLEGSAEDKRKGFNEIALYMVLLGVGCFVCAWIGHAGFKAAGLRQSAMWRKAYLTAILRQDVGWFDVNNPGELSSKIAESTQLIEEGIGSKLSVGSRMLMQFLGALAIAFYYTWDMSLVLVAISPISMFGAWYFSHSATAAYDKMSKAYAKAGGTAHESLSEMRTASLSIRLRHFVIRCCG